MAVYRFGRWRYGFRHRSVRAPLSFIYKIAVGIPARIIPRQSDYDVQGAENIRRLSES